MATLPLSSRPRSRASARLSPVPARPRPVACSSHRRAGWRWRTPRIRHGAGCRIGAADGPGHVGAVSAGTPPAGSGKAKSRATLADRKWRGDPAIRERDHRRHLPPLPGAVAGSPSTLSRPMRLGQGQPVSPAGSAAYSGAPVAAPSTGASQLGLSRSVQEPGAAIGQCGAAAADRPRCRSARRVAHAAFRALQRGAATAAAARHGRAAAGRRPAAANAATGILRRAASRGAAAGPGRPGAAGPGRPGAAGPGTAAAAGSGARPASARSTAAAAAAGGADAGDTPAVAGGTGYVVQLASFRSEA